jgi:8-oxo-dGTP pyrophosphatase MutT (NUDIX family)
MLNKIRESFQHTRPSDDPVKEVMDRLPKHIVTGYLNNINLKHAGVLLGLQELDSGINIIFTKRTSKLKNHAGEISFPGGSFDESSDTNITETAIREADEEIGLAQSSSEVLGFVPPQISLGTGFIVTPVIAWIDHDFLPIANQDEVEEIFQVPLDFFLDTRNLEHQYRIYDQIKWSVYSYKYQEYYIWGLTAQIMRKFCSLI